MTTVCHHRNTCNSATPAYIPAHSFCLSACLSIRPSVQTLQDKVCEIQARLGSEEVGRHLLLQQLQRRGGVPERTSAGGATQTPTSPNGELSQP